MPAYTLATYAAYLSSAGRRLDPEMVRTMSRAGLNIRDNWRTSARALNRRHAPKYAGTIRMERTIVIGNDVTVTVAPGWYGQGPLAAVLERGSPTSRPQFSDIVATRAEVPNLTKWLKKIAADNIR